MTHLKQVMEQNDYTYREMGIDYRDERGDCGADLDGKDEVSNQSGLMTTRAGETTGRID